MAAHWIGLDGLMAALVDAARPLLDHTPEAKHRESAARRADSQARSAPARAAPAPRRVARALPLAQVVEIEAEPSLEWAGAGWRAVDTETRVVIRASDGAERTCVLEPGASLPVAGGMILIPPG